MTVAIREPAQVMSSGLDNLRDALSGLDDSGITRTLREVEALSRQVRSVLLDVVAEADTRG